MSESAKFNSLFTIQYFWCKNCRNRKDIYKSHVTAKSVFCFFVLFFFGGEGGVRPIKIYPITAKLL